MNFSYSLAKWGTDEFEDAVHTQLMENEGDLPLGDFCQDGGAPDPEGLADFAIDSSEETQTEIVVKASAYFVESSSTACKDINNKERRHGRLIIKIDKSSGSADIESDVERFNAEYY
ncbi:MAG: hypothetical protein QOF24_2296 [Verrucomicrobiota bacterium]